MSPTVRLWIPAALLFAGAAFTVGVDRQKVVPLRESLAAVAPATFAGLASSDMVVPEEELRVAGVSDYLLRAYHVPGRDARESTATLYVGYYDQQTQGKTIHSPKNCLPGAGWEALQSERITMDGPRGPVTVNRYLLQREEQRALVLYWYQGRGRIEANEYVVKANLLRDSAIRGRSEEALVRVVVPLAGSTDDEVRLAVDLAEAAAASVDAALPTI